MIRKLVLAGIAALGCILWLPAAAQAQIAAPDPCGAAGQRVPS